MIFNKYLRYLESNIISDMFNGSHLVFFLLQTSKLLGKECRGGGGWPPFQTSKMNVKKTQSELASK